MSDWIPLLTSAVWPVAIGIFLLVNRRTLGAAARAIVGRIESGAPLRAGGVELGSAPSLPPVKHGEDPRTVDALPHDIYMVHTATRASDLDRDGQRYYRLHIHLDADEPQRLDDVERVTYRLHPTFKNPVREATDRATAFEMRTAAWGEFNMTAEILLRDGQRIVVERYINLPLR